MNIEKPNATQSTPGTGESDGSPQKATIEALPILREFKGWSGEGQNNALVHEVWRLRSAK